ncbi:MAG: HAD hydrolase-like protein [Boseongicola sp.]|nr:MAG: HAD hydrolase-like protein [Boseongicola sp.]
MTAVFLDLDGTLMDSKRGIESSLRYAFSETGQSHHAEGDLTWMIGPPFVDSFSKLGIENADPILDAYRVHYQKVGMFDATVYEGVMKSLATMRDNGHRLYLMPAKPHHYARKITAHFGIAPFLKEEFGPELDGTRNWKGELLAYALDLTGETADASVMVGDRHHDMAAAAEVGMAAIAAKWGYGSSEDWQGAQHFLERAHDLPQAVNVIRPIKS